MKILKDDWTPEKIVDAMKTWHNYPGFSGETCGNCGLKANVLAGGPGWFCPVCVTNDNDRSYNCQSWSCHQMPWEFPDYGPSQEILRIARTLIKLECNLL